MHNASREPGNSNNISLINPVLHTILIILENRKNPDQCYHRDYAANRITENNQNQHPIG